MGIELPSDLAGVAAAAGVQWPQADEDAMRASATAWRQAGQSLTAVSTDADGSASKALAGAQGESAIAAQQHWNGFIEPDSGKLTTTVQGCGSAADQLEHAADQVGEAKVQIVQHLVTLAKNTDAAHQAVAAGNPNAAIGLNTAVRGTAANVAKVNANLTSSIRLDSGATVYGQPSPVNANPGGGTFAGGAQGGGGLSGLEPLLGKAAGPVPQAGHGAGDLAGHAANLGTGPIATVTGHGGPGSPGGGPGSPGGPGLPGVAGGGGPGLPVGGHGASSAGPSGGYGAGGGVPAGVVPGHGGGGTYLAPAGENTGPIQLPPIAGHGATLGTAPEAHTPPLGIVQQSAYSGPSVSPAMPPFAGAASVAPVAPVVNPGQGPVGFAPMGPDAGLPAMPVAPVAPVQGGYGAPAPSWGGQYAGGAVGGGAVGGSPVPAQYLSGSNVSGAYPAGANSGNAGGGAIIDQPGIAPSHSASRSSVRRSSGPRDPEVAIFLVHMFPIGHLPVASSRPVRQLPVPSAETDLAAGSRFEPHDHPDSAIFDTGTRSGDISSLTGGESAPEELTEGYDPLGGGNEADWDRRFLVRPETEGEAAEYAWPPGPSFPEGGCDHGEAVRLAPGTILDRFGGNEGRVFSVPSTSFAARSLPPAGLSAGYHRYEVRRELPMWWALSTAWFGQSGGGVRYRAVYPAADLVAMGFLIEINLGKEQ
jgi:hypothetical protein